MWISFIGFKTKSFLTIKLVSSVFCLLLFVIYPKMKQKILDNYHPDRVKERL